MSAKKYQHTAVALTPENSAAITTGALQPTVAYPSVHPGTYDFNLNGVPPPKVTGVADMTANWNTFPAL